MGRGPGNYGRFLTSAATSMLGGAAKAGTAAVFSGAQSDGQRLDPNEYFVNTLFRSEIQVQTRAVVRCAQRPEVFLPMPFGKAAFLKPTRPI
jgi:hypothetical protein